MMQGEKKIKIRFWSRLVISSLLFLSFFLNLFVIKDILTAGLFFLLFDLALGFLAIEKISFDRKNTFWVLLIWSILLILFLPIWNWQTILAVIISIWGCVGLRYQQKINLKSFRTFQTRDYFASGSGILMTIFSLIFGFAMLGNFQTLPFSCSEVENLTQRFQLISFQNQEVEETDYEEGFLSNLGTRIKRTKDLVWDNVLETQKELNHQVCLSMYNQLQKVYQLPAFQIAFLVALYMLSFWVMRFILKIIAGIGVLIFWMLMKCWVYQKVARDISVESIE